MSTLPRKFHLPNDFLWTIVAIEGIFRNGAAALYLGRNVYFKALETVEDN